MAVAAVRRRGQRELAAAIVSLGACAAVTGSSVRAWLPGRADGALLVEAQWLPGDRVLASGVSWGPWPRRRVWVWRTAGGIRGVQPRADTGATAAGVVVLLRRIRGRAEGRQP